MTERPETTESKVIPSHFFAWAYSRALAELERRMTDDPTRDPNWTFSEIMEELLAEYRRLNPPVTEHLKAKPDHS